jgi:hypothetical protein
MKLGFCIVLSLLFVNSYGQINKFEGSLLIKNKVFNQYFLEIDIDSNYNLVGQSTLKTKTDSFVYPIEGSFDPKNNNIFYKELDNNNRSDDCPIYVQARVSHLMADFYVLAGLYVAQHSSRCDPGHINIINRNFKFNLYNKKADVISGATNDSVNQLVLSNLLNQSVAIEKKFQDVTAADKISIKTHKANFTIKIYDQLRIDKDKVRIVFNNKKISDIELKAKSNDYQLVLNKGINLLKIEALDEGQIPMNTSKFEVLTTENQLFYTNLLYKGQTADYLIYYE